MAVVTIPRRHAGAPTGVRRLDVRRDLRSVVKLIELGFGAELDPPGWKMLNQMRQQARWSFLAPLLSDANTELAGFVWEENGHVVGNLSLRPASPRTSRGWMIGNVVVHPNYQGRGIARMLMQTALDEAQQRRARWIGLEVRADNAVARSLYERLGFRGVGQTAHLLRPGALPWPSYGLPGAGWRPAQPHDAALWVQMAEQIYNAHQRNILEIRSSLFKYGGWERALDLWLQGQRERAWIDSAATPHRAVGIHSDRRQRFHTWDMLLDPQQGMAGAEETVARALAAFRSTPPWPVSAIVQEDSPLLPVLEQIGFQRHRTLLQMHRRGASY